MKHYLFLGGRFKLLYMYFDLNVDEGYVADSLFFKRNITVYFGDELAKDGDKYRVIFCKIKRKNKEQFEEALEELKNKMALLGHLDYEDYCHSILNQLEDAKDNKGELSK